MSINISPSINALRLERDLIPERLARTVCEIDPSPRSPFAVAVVLEVLGYSDRLAKDAGWADIFALARDVFDRIEFLGTTGAFRTQSEQPPAATPVPPSPIMSVVAQQAVWLVMVVLMLAWGRSVWSADHVPPGVAQALAVGVLASLVVSGGFQYAITRRFIFHIGQRDLTQAQAFLHRALWAGGAVMSAGALAVAGGMWRTDPQDHLAPLVAGSYFLLHGNYRVAVVPLIALNDVVGIVLSTGIGVALLVLTYAGLLHGGADGTMAIVCAQLVGLAALWLGSLARTRSLLGGVRTGPVRGVLEPRGWHDRGRDRWFVLCLDAVPWFATGIGGSLMALTYARLLRGGADATMAIVCTQLVGLTALWLGTPARTRSLLGGVRIGLVRGVKLGAPRWARDLAHARWSVLCLGAAPWFATGIGGSLVALTYARLLRGGADGTMAIVCAQLVGLTALWVGSLARTHPRLGDVRIGGTRGVELGAPRAAGDLAQPRWSVLCLDAVPWFALGVLYYLFLFVTRPIAWMLPAPERLVYESGVDLGILGIVPIAIAASWGLYRYYQELREQLMSTAVLDVGELRARATTRFSRILWRCRWVGAATALGLLAATGGAPWGTMNPETFLVFRITVVGLTVALPGFLFSFGLLTSLGALWDAGGVLVCGLIVQVGMGLFMAQRGTAEWLAVALVGSAAALSELAVWRAKRIVRNIDRHYYAAF